MKNVPARQVTVPLALLLFLSVFPRPLLAQQEGSQRADIVIYLIEASNQGQGVDPQIQHLVKEFKGAFGYSRYQLVSKIPRQLKTGEKEMVTLPGKRQMQLQMQGYEANRIKLKVKVAQKSGEGGTRDILNTEFRIIEGGTIMIGGYDYQDGKLIIAISAGR